MTRRLWTLVAIGLAIIALVAVWAGRAHPSRELLRDVYSPTFAAVPPKAAASEAIAALRDQLASPACCPIRRRRCGSR